MSESPRQEFERTGGTPCRVCGSTARACQYSYVQWDKWCCDVCRRFGAAQTHREPEPANA